MELQYYVLGKKGNSMLTSYEEKYYIKLLHVLQKLDTKDFFFVDDFLKSKKSEKKQFLLHPDISSLIQSLFISSTGFDRDTNLLKFKNEISYFLSGEEEKCSMNLGKIIGGTNIRLTLSDNNPYNIFDEHPDHKNTGGVLGWGKKGENEWLDIYAKTFSLLKKVDSGFYDELNHIIKKIVPLGTSHETHNSASYSECIGTLYLGCTLDSTNPEINNLEAIIHESSHNKLNLLFQFDPIILNSREEIYYSAIRPDARPIRGVFIGYHAFAPTMYIIMKAYKEGYLGNDEKWLDKIVLYYLKTKFLQKTIKKYGQFTPLGKEICEEIDIVIMLMDKLFKGINPSSEIIMRAKRNQENHFFEVNKNYLYLKY